MKKYNAILIDCQNLFFRAFFASLKQFISIYEEKVCPSSLEISFKMINRLKKEFGYDDTELYFLFDNPESNIRVRKDIFSEYKSIRERKNVPEGFYETMALFIELLKDYYDNSYVLKVDKLEADDLTLPVLNKIGKDKNNILIVSNDLDFARNIEENIDWWNYHRLYTREIFEEEFGFSPVGNNVQLYKSIHGDKSDNIPNAVKRLPKKLLTHIINSIDSIEELFTFMSKLDIPDLWKAKIRENRIQILTNYQLVDFVDVDLDIDEWAVPCRRDLGMLRQWFKGLHMDFEKDMAIDEKKNKLFCVKPIPRI